MGDTGQEESSCIFFYPNADLEEKIEHPAHPKPKAYKTQEGDSGLSQ